jgi:quercetin dioxygenase-like cupin family protein
MPGYTIVQDPLKQQPIPEEGILTRQLFEDQGSRVVLFTFSTGQRLSEHTASTPALLHFLKGEATITLGQDTFEVATGTWIRMDAGLTHSIVTKSPVVMLLVLLKGVGKKEP